MYAVSQLTVYCVSDISFIKPLPHPVHVGMNSVYSWVGR